MATVSNRRKMVIGNWKMNGSNAENAALLDSVLPAIKRSAQLDIAICPPYPYLDCVAQLLKGSDIALGAQNLCSALSGAHTGEVSGQMLRDFGCRYVLVGHSERRAMYGDNDAGAAEKFAAALSVGLVPVLCVGETLAQRELGETQSAVLAQLSAVISAVGASRLAKGVIAYEPIWAIGTGKTASPEQAQLVHRQIREWLSTHDSTASETCRILYGGSVNADNAEQLFLQPDIDGGLIGGASLDPASFAAIIAAACSNTSSETWR